VVAALSFMASTAAAMEAADVDVEHPVHVPRHQRLIQGVAP
jgi:hypothetical protein